MKVTNIRYITDKDTRKRYLVFSYDGGRSFTIIREAKRP